MHELRGDGAIHASAYCSNYTTFGTANFTDACDFLPDELFLKVTWINMLDRAIELYAYHCPVLLASTNTHDELANDFLTTLGMRDFGVELDAVEGLGVVGDGGEGRSIGASDHMEIDGESGKLVAVGHPHLRKFGTDAGRTL